MFYLDLFESLQKHRVRYLLVGGLAMNLHGVPRMTMDVDLVLALDDANLDKFIACASELGLRPQAPVPLVALKDAGQRRQWIEEKHMVAFALSSAMASAPTVDVLIRNDLVFDEAYARRLARDLGGVRIDLATIDDMIRLKEIAGRLQDLSDIEHLRRLVGKSGTDE